jgi:DNA-binding helix-hairpin-helix protein with protein kinase domain
MTAPVLLCGSAHFPIAERIGRGGEGEIYAAADGSGRAVKVYLVPDTVREAKVRDIIARDLGSACSNVTFPLEIVRTTDGRFAGFTMRRVINHQPIHELITTASRREHFPKTDYRFIVHVALNVARIVAHVHAAGVVIGDINSAGFLVAQNGTVTLIDADSFQIGTHRCRVAMPEFTPPELQCMPFGAIDRAADHDAFGLAVILFQLLALGRHPYAGVVRGRPIPLEQAIIQGRFAYSLLRTVGATPPPGALRLDDLPRSIRILFERAFAGRGRSRPSAVEWVNALGDLATSLTPCPRISNHDVSQEAVSCPWCRIERETGRPIFPGGVTTTNPGQPVQRSKIGDDVAQAIKYAKRHAGEAVMPMWSRQDMPPSNGARKALDAVSGRICLLISGVRQKFIERNDAAQLAATRALDEWRTRLGIWDIAKLIDQLRGYVGQIDRLRTARSAVVARAAARITGRMATDIMARETIHQAKVPGIGSALRTHLVTHGITSAADVSRPALTAIGGIGEARIVSLLFWREEIAVRAEHTARSADQEKVFASAEAAVAQHERQLELRAQALLHDLETKVARVRKAVWLLERDVEAALAARDQAAADLAHLGIPCHALRNICIGAASAPSPAKVKKGKAGKKWAARTCPRCGSSMVKRWGPAVNGKPMPFLGCSAYPNCHGTSTIRKKRLP